MNIAAISEASEIAVLLTDFPVPCFTVSVDRVVSVLNAAAKAIAHEELGGGRSVSDAILEQLDALSAGQRAAWSHDPECVIQIAHDAAVRFFLPQFFRIATGWSVLFSEVTDLWEACRSMTRAFSVLGHEVKTPITSIRMALHLLLEEKLGALTPEQCELVEASRDECENMLHLVHQINEIFLIESGGDALTRTLVEPSRLLDSPLAEKQFLFKSNAQRIVINTPVAELPRINIDVSKVERAIGELLRHAALVGVPGADITISFSLQNGWLRIGVGSAVASDSSKNEKRKVFEPFGLRRGPRGADLGLVISKALVTAHGGRTGVKTTERGQELYLEFPTPAQS